MKLIQQLKYLLLCSVFTMSCFETLADSTKVNASPKQVEVFKVPEKYRSILSGYRAHWVSLTGLQYSGVHWNQFVSTYINQSEKVYKNNHQQYLQWYDDPDDEDNTPVYQKYPKGTILIKENYLAEKGNPGKAVSLTVMIKEAAGYDSEHGDWKYLQISPEGRVIVEGAYTNEVIKGVCADCHNNVAKRDYVFSSMLASIFIDNNKN